MNKIKEINFTDVLEKGKMYLILIDWQNQQNNRILFSTNIHVSDDLGNFDWEDFLSKENMLIDYEDLYGTGCDLCISSYIGEIDESENYDDEWCDNIIIRYDSKKHLFYCDNPIEEFPVIENELIAGIYEINALNRYWIETPKDLNVLLKYDWLPFEVSWQKIICRPEKIEIFDFINEQVLFQIERLPDDYFDIYCPICHQAVISCDRKINCSKIEKPCKHFIGEIAIEGLYISADSVKDLTYTHQIKAGNLYIEINGSWQQAIVCEAPKNSENSYWTNDDITHFVFVDVIKSTC